MMVQPIIPVWLMAVICGGLVGVVIATGRRGGAKARGAGNAAKDSAGAAKPTRGRRASMVRRILMVGLLFVINLRVMVPTGEARVATNNLDVLFVIDDTSSMNAEDYNGRATRLSGVKADCGRIVDRLGGARFSVIAFNNDAKVLTPYTQDADITMEAIETLGPVEDFYARGTSLNTPVEAMTESLETSRQKGGRRRVVFLISDGEITDDSKLESYGKMAKLVDDGAVLGYGTSSGGYMKQTTLSDSGENYIIDYSSEHFDRAVSRIDEGNLQSIARDLGVDYINMGKQNNLDGKLAAIQNAASSGTEVSDESNYDDTYYLAVIPLLGLLLWEMVQMGRKGR